MLGLLLIAIGTGGIKPCVAAFGGDQFKLPEQARQLQTFFSVFYFSINAGSLISTFITPIFRQDIQCFGDDTCYALAFGVPALLMLVATVILVVGDKTVGYTHKAPQGSILTQVFGAIGFALKKKISSSEKPDHWLDLAKTKYTPQLVEDVKIALRVLVIFIPLPVFWALFDQQGSRWTFQATRMNGQIGSYIIKPDQMQLFNPAFILILIPLFDQIVYPLFAKINFLNKPLQRMVTGGVLTGCAYFISGFLELQLAVSILFTLAILKRSVTIYFGFFSQQTYGKIPAIGESHAHVMNLLPCDLSLRISNANASFDHHFDISQKMNSIVYDLENGSYDLEVRTGPECKVTKKMMKLSFEAKSEIVSGFLVRSLNGDLNVMSIREAEEPKKRDDAAPKFKYVLLTGTFQKNLTQPLLLLYFQSCLQLKRG